MTVEFSEDPRSLGSVLNILAFMGVAKKMEVEYLDDQSSLDSLHRICAWMDVA